MHSQTMLMAAWCSGLLGAAPNLPPGSSPTGRHCLAVKFTKANKMPENRHAGSINNMYGQTSHSKMWLYMSAPDLKGRSPQAFLPRQLSTPEPPGAGALSWVKKPSWRCSTPHCSQNAVSHPHSHRIKLIPLALHVADQGVIVHGTWITHPTPAQACMGTTLCLKVHLKVRWSHIPSRGDCFSLLGEVIRGKTRSKHGIT